MYKYNKDNASITRLSDDACIPIAGGNRDYNAAMEWVAQGNTIAPYVPPPPTTGEVNQERDKRMEKFTFGGKEYDISKDNGSLANVSGAGTLALGAIVAGAQPGNLRWADPNVDFSWIAEDNSLTTMDAQTTWAFAQAAAAWRKTMIYKARAIKDQQEIPADYKNNSHWE
jgi:hypothetical protein